MKEKILYDEAEKKFKKKYYTALYSALVLLSIIEISVIQKDYLVQLFIVQIVFALPFIPNLIFLKKIKCPNCGKNYFTPFLASKNEIKNLLKSNPKCVNCNYEAEIISEYKTMY